MTAETVCLLVGGKGENLCTSMKKRVGFVFYKSSNMFKRVHAEVSSQRR